VLHGWSGFSVEVRSIHYNVCLSTQSCSNLAMQSLVVILKALYYFSSTQL
jgi:hypothetical protein